MEAPLTVDGSTLTCAQVREVARQQRAVWLDPVALERVAAAQAVATEATGPVYGRTTGVGANREFSVVDSAEHGLRLLRSHTGGAGPLVAPELARALLLVRLNQLAAGGSGVAPGALEAMAEALNLGLLPPVRTFGSVGTGDLTALAATALCLRGELGWLGSGAAWRPFPLDPGQALAFVSSNAASIGEAALACADAADLLAAALPVTALVFLAARGSLQAYQPAAHQSRPHPGQAWAAGRLYLLLVDQGAVPARLQDPFCLRAAPQVHGPVLEQLATAEATVSVELNAAAENPRFDAAGRQVLHNGNFHTAGLAVALDAFRLALYQSAALSVARLAALLEPAVTGLPAFLATGPAGSSGLMILEYVAHSALAELRQQATPVTLGSAVLSRGVEEHAPFTAQAARATTAALAAYRTVLAVEAVAAVRALRLAGRKPVGELGTVYRMLADTLDPDLADRPCEQDVDRAATLLPDLARLALSSPFRPAANRLGE